MERSVPLWSAQAHEYWGQVRPPLLPIERLHVDATLGCRLRRAQGAEEVERGGEGEFEGDCRNGPALDAVQVPQVQPVLEDHPDGVRLGERQQAGEPHPLARHEQPAHA